MHIQFTTFLGRGKSPGAGLLGLLCLSVLWLGPTSAASAQGGQDWVDVDYTIGVIAGGTADVALAVNITIRDDWKMYAVGNDFPPYSLDLSFDVLPPGILEGGLRQTEPKQAYDKNFNKEVFYFQHEARLFALLDVAESASPSDTVSGTVLYQICSDSRGLCLPPTREPFSVSVASVQSCMPTEDSSCELIVLPSQARAVKGSPGETEDTIAPTAAQQLDATDLGLPGTSSTGFILLALAAGFGALLTPCVFPMIPLTVSFFAKHTASRGESVRMAVVYGSSIVVTFTALGVVMASVYGAAGVQTIASSPWVNLFFAALLLFFALSLLGLFELRLPNGLLNFFNKQSNERSGWVGIVFMGLTITLVSFSCTAPFVGGLLAAAARGSIMRPIIGMAVFSTAFALPFVFLALFPRALQSLPRSGSWMNAVKVTLGFVELAAAIKFLSNADLVWGWNLISRPLAIAVTAVIFFMAGLYLLGKLRLAHEEIASVVGVPRLMAAIGFFGVGLYLIPGLFGAPLNSLDAFLPPRQATDVRLLGSLDFDYSIDEGWIIDDIDGALALASVEKRPVLVDFTGYTCTNCRQMESTVFPVPAVADRLGRDFVLLRLYTDGQERGDDFQRYQLKLTGTVALPTYAVLAPNSGRMVAKTSGLQSATKFAAFLRSGHEAALSAMSSSTN